MNLLEDIYLELALHGLKQEHELGVTEIHNKMGIHLYRIEYRNNFFILKYFEKEEFKREISNYKILQQLNVPTLKVFSFSDKSLLMEDLDKSNAYRLGTSSDLSDNEVARCIAKWYKKLHQEGTTYLAAHKGEFYKESNQITKENIEKVIIKSNTSHLKVWNLILNNLDLLLSKLDSFEETITYNDFYWTNLAVCRNKTEALMFDYNFLGSGFRYNDIRNVCNSLSEEAREAFKQEYGWINEDEKKVDAVMCILFDLIVAYDRPTFPSWSQESLDAVYNGRLEEAFKLLLI